MGILHLGERPRVRLFLRRDRFGRFLSCLVFVPRDRFNTQVREAVQEILEETFNGALPTTTSACRSRSSRGSIT